MPISTGVSYGLGLDKIFFGPVTGQPKLGSGIAGPIAERLISHWFRVRKASDPQVARGVARSCKRLMIFHDSDH